MKTDAGALALSLWTSRVSTQLGRDQSDNEERIADPRIGAMEGYRGANSATALSYKFLAAMLRKAPPPVVGGGAFSDAGGEGSAGRSDFGGI